VLPRVGWASRPSARGTEKTGETPVPHFPSPLRNLKSSYPLTDARSVREGLLRNFGVLPKSGMGVSPVSAWNTKDGLILKRW